MGYFEKRKTVAKIEEI